MNPGRRRLRSWLGAVAVLVVVAASAYVVGSRARSSGEAAALAAPPIRTVLTEPVRIGVLEKSVVFRATVERRQSQTISPVASDPEVLPVVTGLGPKVGAQVDEGDLLYEIAGTPTVMLRGRFPMYRNLAVGDSGPDVDQLKASLRRLGLQPGAAGDTFDRPTADAFAGLLARHGYDVADGAPVRRGQVVFVEFAPGTYASSSFRVGSVLDGTSEFTVEGGALVGRGFLPVADADILSPGDRVSVTDDSTGQTASATVTSLGETSSSPATGAPVRRVRVRLPSDFHASTGEVRVSVDVARTDQPVLSVPITAIRSLADGTAAVVVQRGGEQERVVVRPGVEADGWVAVEGAGQLAAGDLVVVG